MYWQIDTRGARGGYWECRERRRDYNRKRLRVFGQRIYLPDQDAKEFARQLREERKESRGDTQD